MIGLAATIGGLAVVGVVVLVALQVVYANRPPAPADFVYQLLNVGAWTAIIIGLLGLMLVLTGPFAVVLIFVAPAVAAIVYAQHLTTQRRILLSVMAIAAERNMPLAPALRAFASEFRGRGRHWAMRLAQLLEEGLSLTEAIQRSPGALPRFSAVYAQVGESIGDSGAALREATATQSWGRSLWNSLAGWVFYVLIVVEFGLMIVIFSLIKLVPAFAMIFDDFGLELPALTRGIIGIGSAVAGGLWPLLVLAILGLGAIAFFCFAFEIGWIGRLPGLNWLSKDSHAAVVLRNLALATERGRPIQPLLLSMATAFPSNTICRQLSSIAGQASRGHDWRDGMQAHGLIGQTDAVLLESAERTGNLPWALRTVADRRLKRLAYRIQAFVQFVFPWIIVGAGILVFLFVVGMFLPLIDLIAGLT